MFNIFFLIKKSVNAFNIQNTHKNVLLKLAWIMRDADLQQHFLIICQIHHCQPESTFIRNISPLIQKLYFEILNI